MKHEHAAEKPQDLEPQPPFPPQKLKKPGIESELRPRPRYKASDYKPAGKLDGKVAVITGGDSGIGRSVAVVYAKEGADIAITALPAEHGDAEETKRAIESAGRRCMVIEGDLSDRGSRVTSSPARWRHLDASTSSCTTLRIRTTGSHSRTSRTTSGIVRSR